MSPTALTTTCAARGIDRDPQAGIFAVIDEDGVFARLTAEHLDAWFAGLAPELKANIYELATDGPIDEPGNVLQALSLRNGLVAHCDAVEQVIEGFVGRWGALQAEPLRLPRPDVAAVAAPRGVIADPSDLRGRDVTPAGGARLSERLTGELAALAGGHAGTHLVSLRGGSVDAQEVA